MKAEKKAKTGGDAGGTEREAPVYPSAQDEMPNDETRADEIVQTADQEKRREKIAAAAKTDKT